MRKRNLEGASGFPESKTNPNPVRNCLRSAEEQKMISVSRLDISNRLQAIVHALRFCTIYNRKRKWPDHYYFIWLCWNTMSCGWNTWLLVHPMERTRPHHEEDVPAVIEGKSGFELFVIQRMIFDEIRSLKEIF